MSDHPNQEKHPYGTGAMICHINQMWAVAGNIATAVVHEVKGPCGDGSYEYLVTTTEDFSTRPSEDNRMLRRTWWNSRAVHLVDDGTELPQEDK